ncbi:hypothetical protein [Lysobacter capsici]|uniref:hypothetical protein n=1 Tax=Lysobacter capsici TaxID=435897 RepID=UPI001C006C58|nr:hypothetical protein [Lysobacter capsici]MBW8811308.1 hypothetical protein [Lysobacter sp.]QWF17186.1 hypothetical protein KME82_26255 [Lysobacter capsici]
MTDTDLPLDGPFAGIDLDQVDPSLRRSFIEAAQDFAEVIAGRSPRHAGEDREGPVASDGGSRCYRGHGYSVLVLKRLAQFGGVDGLVYGPILSFDEAFGPHERQLSSTRFYTYDALRALLGRSA